MSTQGSSLSIKTILIYDKERDPDGFNKMTNDSDLHSNNPLTIPSLFPRVGLFGAKAILTICPFDDHYFERKLNVLQGTFLKSVATGTLAIRQEYMPKLHTSSEEYVIQKITTLTLMQPAGWLHALEIGIAGKITKIIQKEERKEQKITEIIFNILSGKKKYNTFPLKQVLKIKELFLQRGFLTSLSEKNVVLFFPLTELLSRWSDSIHSIDKVLTEENKKAFQRLLNTVSIFEDISSRENDEVNVSKVKTYPIQDSSSLEKYLSVLSLKHILETYFKGLFSLENRADNHFINIYIDLFSKNNAARQTLLFFLAHIKKGFEEQKDINGNYAKTHLWQCNKQLDALYKNIPIFENPLTSDFLYTSMHFFDYLFYTIRKQQTSRSLFDSFRDTPSFSFTREDALIFHLLYNADQETRILFNRMLRCTQKSYITIMPVAKTKPDSSKTILQNAISIKNEITNLFGYEIKLENSLKLLTICMQLQNPKELVSLLSSLIPPNVPIEENEVLSFCQNLIQFGEKNNNSISIKHIKDLWHLYDQVFQEKDIKKRLKYFFTDPPQELAFSFTPRTTLAQCSSETVFYRAWDRIRKDPSVVSSTKALVSQILPLLNVQPDLSFNDRIHLFASCPNKTIKPGILKTENFKNLLNKLSETTLISLLDILQIAFVAIDVDIEYIEKTGIHKNIIWMPIETIDSTITFIQSISSQEFSSIEWLEFFAHAPVTYKTDQKHFLNTLTPIKDRLSEKQMILLVLQEIKKVIHGTASFIQSLCSQGFSPIEWIEIFSEAPITYEINQEEFKEIFTSIQDSSSEKDKVLAALKSTNKPPDTLNPYSLENQIRIIQQFEEKINQSLENTTLFSFLFSKAYFEDTKEFFENFFKSSFYTDYDCSRFFTECPAFKTVQELTFNFRCCVQQKQSSLLQATAIKEELRNTLYDYDTYFTSMVTQFAELSITTSSCRDEEFSYNFVPTVLRRKNPLIDGPSFTNVFYPLAQGSFSGRHMFSFWKKQKKTLVYRLSIIKCPSDPETIIGDIPLDIRERRLRKDPDLYYAFFNMLQLLIREKISNNSDTTQTTSIIEETIEEVFHQYKSDESISYQDHPLVNPFPLWDKYKGNAESLICPTIKGLIQHDPPKIIEDLASHITENLIGTAIQKNLIDFDILSQNINRELLLENYPELFIQLSNKKELLKNLPKDSVLKLVSKQLFIQKAPSEMLTQCIYVHHLDDPIRKELQNFSKEPLETPSRTLGERFSETLSTHCGVDQETIKTLPTHDIFRKISSGNDCEKKYREILAALLQEKEEIRTNLQEKHIEGEKILACLQKASNTIDDYIDINALKGHLQSMPRADLLSSISKETLKSAIEDSVFSNAVLLALVSSLEIAQAIDKKLLSNALFQFVKELKTFIRRSMRTLTRKDPLSPRSICLRDNMLQTFINTEMHSVNIEKDSNWTYNSKDITLENILSNLLIHREMKTQFLFERVWIMVSFKMSSKYIPDNGKNYPFCEITMKGFGCDCVCAFELSVLQKNLHLVYWQVLQLRNLKFEHLGS